MNITNKFWKTWCLKAIMLMFILLLIWGCKATPVASMADAASYSCLHEGWSQLIDGELIPLDNIQDFYSVDEGDALTFVCTLPEIEDGNVFLFYSANQEVTCELEGVNIHSFLIDDYFTLLKTPGNAWNQIDLDSSMSGKNFTLTFYSEFSVYNNQLNDIYFINNTEVDSLRFTLLWFYGLAALGLFILIIVTILDGFLWKRQLRKQYFFSLSRFYIHVLLWILACLNFYDIFFGRPIISYILSEFFIRLIPISLILLAKNSTVRYEHPRLLMFHETLAVINFILPWVLLFAFKIPLLELQFINYITLMIINILLFIVSTKKLTYYKKLSREEYPILALSILILGGFMDMIFIYFNKGFNTFSGIFSVIGALIYTITIYIAFTSLDAMHEQEKEEITRSYYELQNTTLVQQLHAHFIFNVLNTISALCKEDARKADSAIYIFSTYLRNYLDTIIKQDTIPVTEELEIVRNYLEIEKMRFGEQLSYTFYDSYHEFNVPPLTIQTLVENAVVHGIRGRFQNGEITVTTRKKGSFAQVIISDNGVGFDTDKPFKASSIGLDNVKKRVSNMCEGTLIIDSIINEGTTILISIPLDKI